MSDPIVIVGSGPSGVSAAWPLLQAGHQVMMLDQGREGGDLQRNHDDMLSVRMQDEDQWRQFLGDDLAGVGADSGDETPKLKVPAHEYVHRHASAGYDVSSSGIRPTISLARGGISAMWGAGAFTYEDDDLSDFPISRADLTPSYQRVATRIGISGVLDDKMSPHLGDDLPLMPPIQLHPSADKLLNSYQRRAQRNSADFLLGRTRNAVITEARPGREVCALDNHCMWGCSRKAIYNAADELDELRKFPNFQYVPGAFVHHVIKQGEAFELHTSDVDTGAGLRTYTASHVLLAAGTIASTALALDSVGVYDQSVPLACHPAFAMGFVVPQRIGSPWSHEAFSLGHLAYRAADGANNDYAFGVVFALEGVMATDVARRMPLTSKNSLRLAGALIPSILVANGYLHSDYSQGSLTLRQGDRLKIELQGQHASTFEAKRKRVMRKIARNFLRYGAVPLPMSGKAANLGSDGHFCGTLPMSEAPGQLQCSVDGELAGQPGLFLVDGASLPNMTAKHPTFTFMANSDRIAHKLAARLKSV